MIKTQKKSMEKKKMKQEKGLTFIKEQKKKKKKPKIYKINNIN